MADCVDVSMATMASTAAPTASFGRKADEFDPLMILAMFELRQFLSHGFVRV